MAKNRTVQNTQDADEIHEENTQVNPAATAAEVKEAENQDNAEKVEQKADENTSVEPIEGDSPEEQAAERAGVAEENLDNPAQNRDPHNKFEAENQENTEEKRKVAHEESNLSREEREEEAQAPEEMAEEDAARSVEVNHGSPEEPEVPQAPEEVTPVSSPEPQTPEAPASNPGSDIAAAITEGLKGAGGRKNFKVTADRSVTPRFGVVRSKRTGDVMLRENETGVLSKVQLESLEEKEASIQGEEVEEV